LLIFFKKEKKGIYAHKTEMVVQQVLVLWAYDFSFWFLNFNSETLCRRSRKRKEKRERFGVGGERGIDARIWFLKEEKAKQKMFLCA